MFTFLKKIFFILLSCILLSSCFTVEKRVYRDGFYVDWHSKQHNSSKPEPHELETSPRIDRIVKQGLVSSPILPEISLENKPIKEKIKISKRKVSLEPIDPVKRKKVSKNYRTEDDGDKNGIYYFSILLVITGFVLTIINTTPVWLVLSGLLAFFINLLFIALSKASPNKNTPINTDENIPIQKRRIPIVTFIGLILGLYACISYFFFFGALTIFASVIGSIFSTDAIQSIKNRRSKSWGMGIAVVAFILSMASLAFISFLVMQYLFMFL